MNFKNLFQKVLRGIGAKVIVNITNNCREIFTQIIKIDKTKRTGLCNRTLTLRTQREVEKQNQYEREWKIKIKIYKFAVIPVSRRKTHELVIEKKKKRISRQS